MHESTIAGVVSDQLRRSLDTLALVNKPDDAWLRLCRSVDPAKAIRDLSVERLTGAEREASDELAKRREVTESNSVQLPYETLALRAHRFRANRGLTVLSSPGGGYLAAAN